MNKIMTNAPFHVEKQTDNLMGLSKRTTSMIVQDNKSGLCKRQKTTSYDDMSKLFTKTFKAPAIPQRRKGTEKEGLSLMQK
jgi:hypothetical protein